MSACSEVTLCDPTDPTIQVKVTDPGTVDAAGFVLPALTPYTGDLSALVKCEEGAQFTDCDGDPLTGGKLQTVEQMLADGQGLYYPFVPIDEAGSPSQQCAPADRVGCLDLAGVTFNESGQTYVSEPGSATWTLQSEPESQPFYAELSVGVINFLTGLTVGTAFTTYATLSLPITNPSTCRSAVVEVDYIYGGVWMETNVTGNSWQVAYANSIGGAVQGRSNNWWANQANQNDELIKFPQVTDHRKFVLAPGATVTVESELRGRALALAGGAADRWQMNDGRALQISAKLDLI